jgi:hypothetical protein
MKEERRKAGFGRATVRPSRKPNKHLRTAALDTTSQQAKMAASRDSCG